MQLTRERAMTLTGIIWIALGLSFYVIPDAIKSDAWLDQVRPILWVIVGLLAIFDFISPPKVSVWVLSAMGVLVTERIVIYILVFFLNPDRPLAWYNSLIWLAVYLAPLFASRIPRSAATDE